MTENVEETEQSDCADCGATVETDTTTTIANGDEVCDDCRENYCSCEDCDDMVHTDDIVSVDSGSKYICDSCRDRNYSTCGCCGEVVHDDETTSVDYSSVCQNCLENNYTWCEECDEYGAIDSDAHHHGGCDCEAPRRSFNIRNDGAPALWNDTRATVTLAAGTISAEGIGAISRLIRETSYTIMDDDVARGKMWELSYNLDSLGDKWQEKTGNYTKRLSRFAYKTYGLKVTPDMLSKIGNIASDHSTAVDFALEVTRNLNLSAAEFGHEESCWFTAGSYGESRCALKSNGGFGLRTFNEYNGVRGRAWVMPLREVETYVPLGMVWVSTPGTVKCTCGCGVMLDDGSNSVQLEGPAKPVKTLVPTFNTETPDAFIVFNGYGDLSGYAPARIVAHMAGMTYRKVGLSTDTMYINGESAYLVAPEDIAGRYTDGHLSLTADTHSDLINSDRERVLVSA